MSAARRAEVAEAGHLGQHAVARAALDDADPAVRATALGALARCQALTDDDLRVALADTDAVVRRRAAELAAHHPGVSLLSSLADPAGDVVEMAAWAVGERPFQEDELQAVLQLAAAHADPLVREAAVATLGALGDDRAVPVIVAAIADKPAIRRRAVIALTPFDGPEVRAALATARTDRDWQVRQLVEELADPGELDPDDPDAGVDQGS